MYFISWCIVFLISWITIEGKILIDSNTVLTRFAFGSCNKHDHNQSIWTSIADYHPQLWMWLGDVVYSDNQNPLMPLHWTPGSVEEMRGKYNTQKQNAEYKRLCQNVSVTAIHKDLGVWDDHDYGTNNGNKNYRDKEPSRHLFLDFLDEPKDSPRRTRPGIYDSFDLGPPGKRVKFIMLDLRFEQENPPNGDILGKQQWTWLEEVIKTSDAQIHFVISGIQFLPIEKPLHEKWQNFHASRARLLDLFGHYQTPGVIILSGDVHYAELLARSCNPLGYPLYELTSSGLTHSCFSTFGPICIYGLNAFFRSRYQISDFYDHLNFGTVEINWEVNPVQILLQIHTQNGSVAIEKQIDLSDLQPKNPQCKEDEQALPIWSELTLDEWIHLGEKTMLVLAGVASLFLFFNPSCWGFLISLVVFVPLIFYFFAVQLQN